VQAVRRAEHWFAISTDRWYVRAAVALQNGGRRVGGNPFRTFVRPAAAMERMIRNCGLRLVCRRGTTAPCPGASLTELLHRYSITPGHLGEAILQKVAKLVLPCPTRRCESDAAEGHASRIAPSVYPPDDVRIRISSPHGVETDPIGHGSAAGSRPRDGDLSSRGDGARTGPQPEDFGGSLVILERVDALAVPSDVECRVVLGVVVADCDAGRTTHVPIPGRGIDVRMSVASSNPTL